MPVQSPFLTHHYLPINAASSVANRDHRIRRMKRALDAADLELVKLMVMGEGLDLRMKMVENSRKTPKLFSTFTFEIQKRKQKW